MASSASLVDREVVPSVIDNKAWEGLKETYDLNDPHSGELLYKVSCVGPNEAAKAVESAAKAFKTWKNTSSSERRAIFSKALRLLEERKDQFVGLTVKETTGNQFWGAVDHSLASGNIEECAALATALKGEIVNLEHGSKAYIERIPYGVVFGIAPWNAPLVLGVRSFTNAIMAGNTVVFKTSEYSPKIHTFAAQLFIDAGLPEGVLNVVHIAPKDAPATCEAIIAHPAVRKVNFTGSTFVGGKIAEQCGKHLKPVCLELGGKAPVVVLKDANLAAAANAVMFGGFSHSGQICMSSDSLIVHEDIAEEFTKVLSSHLSKKHAAAEAEGPTGYRGVFNEPAAKRLANLIDDAKSKGAKVVAGQASGIEGRNVLQPVILGDTKPDMKIYSEEIFGPAMTLTTFKTNEEAIARANSSDYGLAASVYGSNETECWAVAREIESGQVHINGATVHDNQSVPHGGLKKSGFGRFNGIEGLREFTTTKTITVNPPHDQYPM